MTPRPLAALLLGALLAGCQAPAAPAAPLPPWAVGLDGDDAAEEVAEDDDGPGVIHTVLFYIPNRILDVFDIVRARVRLGPGIAVGARATEFADVFAGTYATVFVGLPGPRGRKFPRLPAGLESKSGVEASVADVTIEGPIGPDYGTYEFGVSLQLLLVGVDVGVEPVEVLDLLVGLFTFDLMDDDF